MKSKNSFGFPIAIGLLTFLFGFAIMNVFWIFTPKQAGLMGLYDYLAATIGDGIFLPLLLGSLAYMVELTPKIDDTNENKKTNFIAIGVGMLFGLAGIAIQVQWYLNPNINPNWTIPIPHHFNAAGIYHGFFFSAMFFSIAFLMTLFCMRWRKSNAQDIGSMQRPIFVLSTASSGFMAMLYIDDYHNRLAFLEGFWIVATGVIFILAVFIMLATLKTPCKKRCCFGLMPCILAIVLGTVASYGLGTIIVRPIDESALLIPLIAALYSVVLVDPNFEEYRRLIADIVILSYSTFLCYYMFAVYIQDNYWISALLLLLPIVYALPQIKVSGGNTRRKRASFIFGLSTLLPTAGSIVMIITRNTSNSLIAEIPHWGLSLLVGYASFYIIKSLFGVVIKFENNNVDVGTLGRVKKLSSVMIAMVAIASLLYIALVLSGNIDTERRLMLWDMPTVDAISLGLIVVNLAIVLTLLLLPGRMTIQHGKGRIIAVIGITVHYTLFALLLYRIRQPFFLPNQTSTYQFVMYALAIWVAIGSTVFIAKSYYGNLISLRNRDEDLFLKHGIVWIIALGTAGLQILAMLPQTDALGVPSPSIPRLIMSVICIVALNVVPVRFLKCMVKNATSGKTLAKTKDTGGIVQDGLMASVITILGGLIPLYIFAVIGNETRALSVLINFVFVVCWPLGYSLENNVEHFKRRKIEALGDEDAESKVQKLRYHLAFQNVATIVALFPYCAVLFVWKVVSLNFKYVISDKEAPAPTIKNILSMYIINFTKLKEENEEKERKDENMVSP